MTEWGWRIPFLVAGPLGVVGLYLLSRLEDTSVTEFKDLSAATSAGCSRWAPSSSR